MEYILPNKSLLEKEGKEFENDKYYNLSKVIYHKDFKDNFVIPLGIDERKERYYLDLKKVSGMLISGETGSGKSIFLHSIILSLLLKNSPEDLNFIFYDKSKVELNSYKSLPHLSNFLSDFNNLDEVINILNYRKKLFVDKNVFNIDSYNEQENIQIPRVIVILDEIGDLSSIEKFKDDIVQILSEGYKYGIHIILATSSYLKDYYDDKIIDLFSYILTFDLASKEQAKFIKIDNANLLNIEGDALVKCRNDKILNIQTPYVSVLDIENIVNFINNN